MKTLLLLLLASVSHAGPTYLYEQDFTDITFPASVTVKGQLTVKSTMTVQGNAFSVGGSSFVVSGGSVTVPFRITAGSFAGDGSALTNVAASFVGITSSCAAGYYLSSGTWANGVTTGGGCVLVSAGGANPTGPAGGDLSGTYPNPLVSHVQSGAVDFSTITAALNTKLSSGAIPSGFVDFSTITAALATKASTGTNSDITAMTNLDTLTHALTITSTLTVTGQNATGFSLLVSSGISAQCITLQGGQVCGPTSGGGGSVVIGTSAVAWIQDNFVADGVNKIFNLSQAPTSPSGAGVFIELNDLVQANPRDYTFTAPNIITFTTAPAANTNSFIAVYTVNTSTLPGVATQTGNNVFSGAGNTFTYGITAATAVFSGAVTAGSFVGNGAGLTNLSVNFSTITAALNTKLSSGAAASGDISGNYPGPILVVHTQPGSVDFSTITASLNTKLSSSAFSGGISSTCAAGFYLSSATYNNGVTTGGGCMPVTAGGTVTGTGTADMITKWTGTSSIGDSSFTAVGGVLQWPSLGASTPTVVNGGIYYSSTSRANVGDFYIGLSGSWYAISTGAVITPPAVTCTGTGGTISSYTLGGNDYCVHVFDSNGTFTAPVTTTTVSLRCQAGGGGGSSGGGGAGGRFYGAYVIGTSTADVQIGAGGAGCSADTGSGCSAGSDTICGGVTAIGGGRGNAAGAANGGNGGSGAGGSSTGGTSTGGTGTAGQGNNGGDAATGNVPPLPSGGGGGAGAVGANGANTGLAGAGGNGLADSLTGTSVTSGGGGAGACYLDTGACTTAAGGTGGGGAGGDYTISGTNGTDGLGGGGGGGGNLASGGNGGNGRAVFSYRKQ